jgi:hypothetical protein
MPLLPLPGSSVSGMYVCDKDSAIIFTTSRLPDVNPPGNVSGKFLRIKYTTDPDFTSVLWLSPVFTLVKEKRYFVYFILNCEFHFF